jgi:outer membrane protein TolC
MTLLLLFFMSGSVSGAATTDTLTLAQAYEASEAHFPLMRRNRIAERLLALQLESIDAAYRPSVSLEGQGVFQSAVPEIPIRLPDAAVPSIPRDQYRAALNVAQVLYDGGAGEVSRRLASVSVRTTGGEVDVALHELREHINDAYFGALVQEAAYSTLEILHEEILARRRALRAQVGEGTAAEGAVDVLEVELLSIEQQMISARQARLAALEALGVLTGRPTSEETALVVPDVDVDRARELAELLELEAGTTAPSAAARPRYRLFEAHRERLALEREMLGRKRRPTLAAFATAAYGRPAGLDIFETDLSPFYSFGMRMSWSVWDWKISEREQEALSLRAAEVDAQEDAFSQTIRAAGRRELQEIGRLGAVIAQDRRIVELRERIAERAGRRFENGVISATEFLLQRHAAHRAALQWERHDIERRHAIVRYLTIFGRIDEAL